jgi:hypothetical protein
MINGNLAFRPARMVVVVGVLVDNILHNITVIRFATIVALNILENKANYLNRIISLIISISYVRILMNISKKTLCAIPK